MSALALALLQSQHLIPPGVIPETVVTRQGTLQLPPMEQSTLPLFNTCQSLQWPGRGRANNLLTGSKTAKSLMEKAAKSLSHCVNVVLSNVALP